MARANGRVLGAVVHRHSAARVSGLQLGVQAGEEARVIPALLASLTRPDAPERVRWLNLPADHPAAGVVRALAAGTEASQHEMRLPLG